MTWFTMELRYYNLFLVVYDHNLITFANSQLLELIKLICFLQYCQIGGGSLRIYKREVQEKVFEVIGISPEEVRIA